MLIKQNNVQKLLSATEADAYFRDVMGQVLRITIGEADYQLKVIHPQPLNPATTEIKVELNGNPLTLVRHNRNWATVEPGDNHGQQLAEAIGKAIALRYRI